ncbi:MAG TPA: transcriptional regulator, partial [Verrucomicrobiales bacterium]|nr:transcriptional regulator [Verrucomicrobiales bacterium]
MPLSHRTSGSTARDDYLEQILHLIEEKGYARPIDISKKLEISQASVTNMLKRLDAEGLVAHEKYRGTTLTEEGL